MSEDVTLVLRSEPQHYLQALQLAIVAGADSESAYRLMEAILITAPTGEGQATEPTRILIDAMRALDASIVVNVPKPQTEEITQLHREVLADYDRRREHWWGRFLLWLLRKTT